MLKDTQLCRYLSYLLQTPVRLYDRSGTRLAPEEAIGGQEDPLVTDPAFAAGLLALRGEAPVFFYEEGYVLYCVIPAEKSGAFVLGPVRYMDSESPDDAALAKAHGIRNTALYRIGRVQMDVILESIMMLYDSGAGAELPQDAETFRSALRRSLIDEISGKAFDVSFRLREANSSHNSYAQEVREQKAIREGDLNALKDSWAEPQGGQLGKLGKDPVTHWRNIAVTVITLASRSAIEGGVLPEIAFSLADTYINKINELSDPARIISLFRAAETHYAELVSRRPSGVSHPYVLRCREMILDRLHQRIRVEDLAADLGVTRSYLSKLFYRDEGIRLSRYILQEKVRASEYLLMRSELSLSQIAATFAFSSQSHYGAVFKEINGITPGEYRERRQRE